MLAEPVSFVPLLVHSLPAHLRFRLSLVSLAALCLDDHRQLPLFLVGFILFSDLTKHDTERECIILRQFMLFMKCFEGCTKCDKRFIKEDLEFHLGDGGADGGAGRLITQSLAV